MNRELLRLALITSPIMGLYGLAPMILMVDALPGEFPAFITISRFLVGVIFVSLSSFIFWITNFLLLRLQNKRTEDEFGHKNAHRYLLSYGFTFLYILLIVTVSPFGPPRHEMLDAESIRLYPFIGSFANNTFILLLMNLALSREEKSKLELEKAALEINHLTVQQEQLKQQVHPHFLFNALATLKILVGKNKDTGLEYTDQLAGYLRKSISLAKRDMITVKEDLAFFEDYLKLQQIRFGSSIKYSNDIPQSSVESGWLPVFSLQTLAENALKHNALSVESPLHLSLTYDSEGFIIVENNKQARFQPETSTGLGLENLTKRYALLTDLLPEVIETNAAFSVKLKVLDR